MSANRSSVQLTGDELQQLRWLLGGLLTLVSVATVFYLDIAAWTLLTLTAVGLILVMVWPWLPGRIPRWAHRLAFPIIVAVFTTDVWVTGELLPSLVRLDILLLLYRGISYRQKRDDLQIVVLGLFLLVVAGVLTVSLTFAVHILAFTAGALALLLVITLSDASNALRDRLVRHHESRGVTFMLPETTWIELDVRIGEDTVVYPGAVLEGLAIEGEMSSVDGSLTAAAG